MSKKIEKSNLIEHLIISSRPPYTKIFADGEEIKGVRFFKCEQEVGQELPLLTLEIVPREIEFVGTAVAEIEKPAP